MLTLTEAAIIHLAEILEERDCPSRVAVRFSCQNSSVSVSLDNEKPEDTKIAHQGRTLLLMDQGTAEHLDAETVDVEQTATGGKLFLSKKDTGPA